jgi:hypothetical protein
MVKNDLYYFHQTPQKLAKDLIADIDFTDVENIYEPFAGQGSFYNQFPEGIPKFKSEIEDGEDFKNFDIDANQINTIISNPPFQLNGKNCFFQLIMYFFNYPCIKNVYFLSNDACFGSLTPSRRKVMEDDGIYINKITTCAVKRWRGRYYLVHFSRKKNDNFKYLLENYEYVL